MLTNIISKATRGGLCMCWHQQVRFVRKTFKLQDGYGIAPLYNEDLFLEAKEAGRLEELEYEKVRFARLWENDSVFHDSAYERFVRYVMKGGKKELAYNLMHKTFYEIKTIQLKRLRKDMLKKQQLADKEGKSSTTSAKLSDPTAEEEVIETNPMVVFKKAVENCEPSVITKKIKRGGAVYQVPYPLNAEYSRFLAIKWLIDSVLERPKPRKKFFHEVMAHELIDASLNRGKVIKKRDDMHRLADANKAYAHYRWG